MGSASPYYDADVARINVEVAASQTDSLLLNGETGRRWRVLALSAMATAATALDINSKPTGSGVSISQTFTTANGIPTLLPFNPHGWFQTATGEGLSVTTGTGQTTTINLTACRIIDNGSLSDFQLENGGDLLLEG